MTNSFKVSVQETLRGRNDRDTMYRFLFDTKPVQGLWINVDKALADSVAHQSHYPLAVKKLFAELLLIASVFRYQMKGEGEVSFALRDKNISLMASAGGKEGAELRCVASLAPDLEVKDDAKLEEIMDVNAKLVLSIMPKNEQSYQSIIEANLNSLEESFLDFYKQSVQIPCFLKLATDVDENNNITSSAFFMQYIPDDSGTLEDFNDQVALATSLTQEELVKLSAFDCLYRLFNQEKVTVAKVKDLIFKCTCSEQKILDMLASFGAEQLEGLFAEEDSTSVDCNCCGKNYKFAKAEVFSHLAEDNDSGVFVHQD